jgi:hypothetical protein
MLTMPPGLTGFDQVPNHALRLAPEGHDRQQNEREEGHAVVELVQARADIEVLLEDWRVEGADAASLQIFRKMH